MPALDRQPTSLQSPVRRPSVWKWLVTPAVAIQDPAARRQAQLISSLLLVLLTLTFVASLWAAPIIPGSLPVLGSSFVAFAVLYALSRTEHVRPAGILTFVLLSGLPYSVLLVGGEYETKRLITTLMWGILPLWIASLLFSLRETLGLSALHLAALIGLGVFIPQVDAPTIAFLMLFISAAMALALAANWHRNQLEADRLGQLQASNLRLERELAERQRAQAAVQDREQRIEALLDVAPFGAFSYELQPDGRLVFTAANRSASEILGIRLDSRLTKPIEEAFPDLAQTELPDTFRRVAAYGETRSWEEIEYNDQAIRVTFELRAVQTGPNRMAAFVRDISERKRSEATLQQRQDDLEAAQAMAHLGSWTIRSDGKGIWSKEMFRLHYLEPAAEAPSPEAFMETVHPDDRHLIVENQRAMLGGVEQVSHLYRTNPALGLERVLETQVQALRDETGKVVAWHGLALDVTERQWAEVRLQRQLQRVRALHAIDTAITASLDLRLTLQILLDQVIRELEVDATDVLLLNPNALELQYAAGRGFRSADLSSVRQRLGEGHAGQAAFERRIVNIPDLRAAASEFRRTPLVAGEDFVSYYALPLIAKGSVKGVLEIFHRSRLDPQPDWLEFLETVAGQAAVALDNATLFDDLQRSNIELRLAYDRTIEGWSAALDLRDKETEGHSQRVTELTVRIAQTIGFTPEELIHVRRGALLHDIGKMGIPDAILLKPGKLSDAEWAVMRRHPNYAYEMLSPIAFLHPALDIPYCHHEKWDGTGYPRGLSGEQIPLTARIFAVVDVWDALRSDRPYRPGWPAETVLDHIRGQAGSHFDPQVVDVFLRVMNGQ